MVPNSLEAIMHSVIRFLFLASFFAAAMALVAEHAEANPVAQWRTVKIDDQPYVALNDFATAYGMKKGDRRKDLKELSFEGETRSLLVKVDSRQSIVNGVRNWFSYPVKKQGLGKTFVSLVDINTVLVPTYRPDSVSQVGKVKTIVFDPGHGGHDRGAKSPKGYEKDYALDIVKRSRKILEARGIKVVQSRLSDFFVPLSERPEMTKNYEDPIFVSIHLNAASWRPAASGFEIFSMPPLGSPSTGSKPDRRKDTFEGEGNDHTEASQVLANVVYRTLLSKMDGFDRGLKRARFTVLRKADVPSILIEGGFLTNPEDAEKAHSPAWREEFAKAIADGLEAYMKFANEKKMPEAIGKLGRAPTDEFVPED